MAPPGNSTELATGDKLAYLEDSMGTAEYTVFKSWVARGVMLPLADEDISDGLWHCMSWPLSYAGILDNLYMNFWLDSEEKCKVVGNFLLMAGKFDGTLSSRSNDLEQSRDGLFIWKTDCGLFWVKFLRSRIFWFWRLQSLVGVLAGRWGLYWTLADMAGSLAGMLE